MTHPPRGTSADAIMVDGYDVLHTTNDAGDSMLMLVLIDPAGGRHNFALYSPTADEIATSLGFGVASLGFIDGPT